SIMNIACPPGYESGFPCGALSFGKSTRTCHLPSAVVAVKVHGVVESHLPLTWRLATSIAPSLSRAAAHGAHEARTVAATAAGSRLMFPLLQAAFFFEASEEWR